MEPSQNKHKQKWEEEHSRQASFAAMHTTKPSQPIPSFVDFLLEKGVVPAEARVLDIGCGKGRNTTFMASHGFYVIGTDFSEKALNDARQRSAQYSHLIEYELVDLSKEWPFGNAYFDAIIDCNSSIYMPEEERTFALSEAFRVLKPGGFYLFYGIADTKTLLPSNGPDPFSQVAVFTEKHYTEQELRQAYSSFTIISLQLLASSDKMHGENVQNQLWSMIAQKPA